MKYRKVHEPMWSQPRPKRPAGAPGSGPPPLAPGPRHDRLVVHLTPDAPIETALRRLKRLVRDSGLFIELRRHEAFMPAPARRRLKSLKARQRARRAAERRIQAQGAAPLD